MLASRRLGGGYLFGGRPFGFLPPPLTLPTTISRASIAVSRAHRGLPYAIRCRLALAPAPPS